MLGETVQILETDNNRADIVEVQRAAELDEKILSLLTTFVEAPLHDDEFNRKLSAVQSFGVKHIKHSAVLANRMIARPTNALSSGIMDENSNVSSAIDGLNSIVIELDPQNQGNLDGERKLFGFIPIGSKLKTYFGLYQAAQVPINHALEQLLLDRDELLKDNSMIDQDKASLMQSMTKLKEQVYMGTKLDEKLEALLLDNTLDEDRLRVLQEQVQYVIRQKLQDLLLQLNVVNQAYLVTQFIKTNNQALITSIDRICSTTMTALNTAVLSAQSLAKHKMSLNKMSVLKTQAANALNVTSTSMQQQLSGLSNEDGLSDLRAAFADIRGCLDAVNTLKNETRYSLTDTVEKLHQQTNGVQTNLVHAD